MAKERGTRHASVATQQLTGNHVSTPQAPKKKGGKKKGKGSAKGPAIIDGVAVADMTREQVEGHLDRLREELNREREERNYFQLERDKINTFWEIARQQLDDARAEIR